MKKNTMRLAIGLLVGMAGVVGMASVLLPQGKAMNPAKDQGAAPPGVPPLATTGQTVAIGYASGIPGVTPYDTGAIDTRFMPSQGWASTPVGVFRP